MFDTIETILKKLKKANLPAIVSTPKGYDGLPSDLDAFRINIARDKKKREYFDVRLDEARAGVLVTDVAPETRHALLLIKEDKVSTTLLIGKDETQLFVAPLPCNVSSVEKAFEALKPAEVTDAVRKRSGKVYRQGEFFFVESDFVADEDCVIEKNFRIGTSRNPHIAEEAVTTVKWGVGLRRAPETYVRGRIRHREHHTIKLKAWYVVYRNLEPGLMYSSFVD